MICFPPQARPRPRGTSGTRAITGQGFGPRLTGGRVPPSRRGARAILPARRFRPRAADQRFPPDGRFPNMIYLPLSSLLNQAGARLSAGPCLGFCGWLAPPPGAGCGEGVRRTGSAGRRPLTPAPAGSSRNPAPRRSRPPGSAHRPPCRPPPGDRAPPRPSG